MKKIRKSFLAVCLLKLLFISDHSHAQSIQLIECDVDNTPHNLRIGGNIIHWGYIDRIEERVEPEIEDTVFIDIFFDWCGPPGCCTVYDTTFTLESSFPFNLCVNAYLDSLGPDSQCDWTNDEVELWDTQCLSADQILSAETFWPQNQLKLYPNPTERYLTVETSGLWVKDIMYTARDMNGREVLSGQIYEELDQLDAGSLATGIFILELRSEKGVLRRRFVKSR